MRHHPEIKIGDRVRYSARFLRSIAAYTGDLGHARGVVRELHQLGRRGCTLATVDWRDGDIPRRVNVANLWPEGKLELFD